MTTDSISHSDSYVEPTNTQHKVTTNEARDQLEDTLFSVLEAGENTLIDAPTSLGKSHKVATTPWREYPEVTGGNLVIHLHQTRDARDEAVKLSRETDEVSYTVFEGREDTCPTAAGEYDDSLTAPHGLDPSEWFKWMCDVRKNGFYSAHLELEKLLDMPCAASGTCKALKQWWQTLRDDNGNPTVDVVHTTANFAHVEELIEGANLVFDERPDYALNLGNTGRQQVRDSISNLLDYRSNGEYAVANVTTANFHNNEELTQELRALLAEDISEDWYFRRKETHRLTSEIGLAMLNAEEVLENRWAGEDVDFSGRRMGEYCGVKIVMDSKGKLRHIHHNPNLSDARCVIGLDAYPSEYRWQLNTVDDLEQVSVLSPEDRRFWRREERGLKIVQLGKATRTYTQGWDGAGKERAKGLIRTLSQEYADEFRTCISAGNIEDDVRRFMTDAEMESPPPIGGEEVEPTMHYGGQNSRNDFKNEVVGLLIGCIDPGDKNILDLLALGGQRAWPEMMITEEGQKERKVGRQYEGPAQDTARDILISVRETNLAQAAGRYARSPDSAQSSALVYVWSDACPASLVDETVEVSYHSLTDDRRSIIKLLRDGWLTARDIEMATGSDRSYIYECLDMLQEERLVGKSEETFEYGAHRWKWIGQGQNIEQMEILVQLGD
jgi:hypothetical protein